jgi:hypothetical protein
MLLWLSAWALFMLAIGRGVVNEPGFSTLIGTLVVLVVLWTLGRVAG